MSPPQHCRQTITIPIGAFNSASSLSSPLPFPPPPPSSFLACPPPAPIKTSATVPPAQCLEPTMLAPVTLWVCFTSSLLTILLGFVVIFASGASIHWPTTVAIVDTVTLHSSATPSFSSFPSSSSSAFLTDVNQLYWRQRLFSFTPSVLIDKFTPLLMGILSLLIHTHPFTYQPVRTLTLSFARLFGWTLCVALWGNLGYAGGLGIVVGTVTLLASLLCFISMWACDGPASLNLLRHTNLRRGNNQSSTSCSSSAHRGNGSNGTGTPSSTSSTSTTSTSAGTSTSRKNYDHASKTPTTAEEPGEGGTEKGGSASGRLVEVGGPDGNGCAYNVIVPVHYNHVGGGGTPMEYQINI
eukprot:GHVS01041049.1.p1 GENE.GHVS01041049.1~~GHVS01041049.1.p1  ORF type:complete len:354 (-),score=79.43 GHVS01041049.1:600-1661(-)